MTSFIPVHDLIFQRECDVLIPREVQGLPARELEQVFSQDVRAHGLDERVHKEIDGGEGEDDEVAHQWGAGRAGGQDHEGGRGEDGEGDSHADDAGGKVAQGADHVALVPPDWLTLLVKCK